MKLTRREAMLAVAGLGLSDKEHHGQISAADVQSLMASGKVTRDELMLRLLPEAQSHAHAPISNYLVGAVASGTSGKFYFGQNIEINGNPLGLAVHAEQSAIANAYMAGEQGIDAIAVRASPCGHCRQFLSEVSVDTSMRVLTPGFPERKLADLLPNAFGPKDLGFKQGVFPVRRLALTLVSPSTDSIVQEALKAACQAYAPYSRSPSGAAILTASGRVFAGSYIENAAFNPSLPPLQAALAGYFAGGRTVGEMQRVVLVEGQKNTISQYTTTKATLAAFSGAAKCERFLFGLG